MLKAIGGYVGGKVLTAALVVSVAGGIIYFYNHPEQLSAIGSIMKRVAVWCGFVLVWPWAMFFVPRWLIKWDSNGAAVGVLLAYLAADVVVALLLAGVGGHGLFTWMVLILGFLTAGVYNFVVCDYQVTRLEDGQGW